MNSVYKKNIAGTLITQYGNTVVGFVSSIFITRMLSDYGRGELALYTNFSSLAILFFGFSLPVGAIYYVSSKIISTSRIFRICLTFFLACTVALLLLLLALDKFHLTNLIFAEKNQHLTAYIILALYFFFMSLNAVIAGIFNGLKKINVVNKVSFLFVLINFMIFLGIYFSGYYKEKNVFLIVIAIQCGIQGIQFLINTILLYRDPGQSASNHPTTARLRQDFKMLFKFSRLIYFTNILAFFAYKLDVWIVNYYNGPSQLGIYSLAVSLAQLLWLMPNAVALINISEVAGEKDGDRSSALTVKSYKIALYFTLISGIFFLILCYFFVPTLYGDVFARVPYYMMLLLVGVVPFAPATIISAYLTGVDKYRQNLFAVVAGLLICIALDLVLIPLWGVTGACIASSIAYLTICTYLTIYFVRLTGSTYSELLVLRKQDFINFKKFLQAKIKR